MTHVSDQQMVECFQSAFRKKHSTETALMYVTSATQTAVDNKQGTTLVLVVLVRRSTQLTITSWLGDYICVTASLAKH